jgi:hypothetical protein
MEDTLQNFIVSHVTEEVVVFRACMTSPVLRSKVMTTTAGVRGSYGSALVRHYTHTDTPCSREAAPKIRSYIHTAVLETIFRFTFTSAFGACCVSYAFLRNGSLAAVVTACHAFCNAMGLFDVLLLSNNSSLYHHLLLCRHLSWNARFRHGDICVDFNDNPRRLQLLACAKGSTVCMRSLQMSRLKKRSFNKNSDQSSSN